MQGKIGELLLALERRLLDGAVRRDPAQVAALLHEEFREFGASGREFDREEVLAELTGETGVGLSLLDFEARVLGEEVCLVTYRSRRERDGAVREALRRSVWVSEAGRWRMVFHQGTVVPASLSSE